VLKWDSQCACADGLTFVLGTSNVNCRTKRLVTDTLNPRGANVREHAAANPRLCPEHAREVARRQSDNRNAGSRQSHYLRPLIDDDDGEAEYMVDWRRLRKVYVLECFPAVKREPDEDWAAATAWAQSVEDR